MVPLLSTIRRLFPPLEIRWKLLAFIATLSFYGLFVGLAVSIERLPHIDWGAESAILNGLVLSFLIAFRNKHAYDQWWEARKLWGQLINESRNLCLKLRALGGVEPAARARLGALVSTFGKSLKNHLRLRAMAREAPRKVRLPTEAPHQPLQVAGAIYDIIARARHEGGVDGFTLLWLDEHVKALMDVCGACERIQSTPLSSSYRALLRHAIAFYVIVSPFYLIEDTGLVGFPVFILAAYFLLGIELVAEEIEDPFGTGGDDLPLEQYCATIDQAVLEILGPPTDTDA